MPAATRHGGSSGPRPTRKTRCSNDLNACMGWTLLSTPCCISGRQLAAEQPAGFGRSLGHESIAVDVEGLQVLWIRDAPLDRVARHHAAGALGVERDDLVLAV